MKEDEMQNKTMNAPGGDCRDAASNAESEGDGDGGGPRRDCSPEGGNRAEDSRRSNCSAPVGDDLGRDWSAARGDGNDGGNKQSNQTNSSAGDQDLSDFESAGEDGDNDSDGTDATDVEQDG